MRDSAPPSPSGGPAPSYNSGAPGGAGGNFGAPGGAAGASGGAATLDLAVSCRGLTKVYTEGGTLEGLTQMWSLATEAAFYNLCTNYQVTGEVVTKTVFRMEGTTDDPNRPLRTVVESFQVLPPTD